jgi:hypothetical protein
MALLVLSLAQLSGLPLLRSELSEKVRTSPADKQLLDPVGGSN